MNKNKLKRLLVDRDNCPQELVPTIIEKIENFSPEALALFDEWMDTEEVRDFSIEGITPKLLRESKDMKDIGIIIAYDWIMKEGPKAIEFLKKPIF